MTPEPQSSLPPPQTILPAEPSPVAPRRRPVWLRRVASIVLIAFCLELGLFLLIYPWTDSWGGNYFAFSAGSAWHEIWSKGYVRGAFSGLGLVNIWVAVAEALRMYIGNSDETGEAIKPGAVR